jgi:hypothetical protein
MPQNAPSGQVSIESGRRCGEEASELVWAPFSLQRGKYVRRLTGLGPLLSTPLELSEFPCESKRDKAKTLQSWAETLETNETERYLWHQSEGARDPSALLVCCDANDHHGLLNSPSNAFASLRSTVSKPCVNQS